MGNDSTYNELNPENKSVPLVCSLRIFLLDVCFCDCKGIQVREVISRMRTCPGQRKAIVSDLYTLHCEGLLFVIFQRLILNIGDCLIIEVVLNENEELLHTMIECGILECLADIISSDNSDPGTLV